MHKGRVVAKRYHYDAEGKLKGVSSDKPIIRWRLRDIPLIIIVFVVLSYVLGGDSESRPAKDSPADGNAGAISEVSQFANEQAKVEAVEASTSPTVSGNQAGPTQGEPEQAAATSSIDNGETLAEMEQREFERDLKPYYEKECAKGDAHACTVLEVNALRTK